MGRKVFGCRFVVPPWRKTLGEVIYEKVVPAIFLGGAAGLAGVLFRESVHFATIGRERLVWPLFLLPIAGVIVCALYRRWYDEDAPGVDTVINSARFGWDLRARQGILVFLASVFSHFAGGSVGREGAVLEIGGSIGSKFAQHWRRGKDNRSLYMICGMTAAFSALFGCPLAAVFFILEITGMRIHFFREFGYCLVASLTAWGFFWVGAPALLPPTETLPTPGTIPLAETAILAVGSGLAGIFFCEAVRGFPHAARRLIPNGYLRGLIFGSAVLGLTFLFDSTRYNGLGSAGIAGALGGTASWPDFFLKTIFTALTLAAGMKGGEIIPALFVGSTLGATLGPVVGFESGYGAAVGLVAFFSSVTRCPLATFFLGIELFGVENAPFFALASAVGFLFSGRWSLFRADRNYLPSFRRTVLSKKPFRK